LWRTTDIMCHTSAGFTGISETVAFRELPSACLIVTAVLVPRTAG